MHTNCNFIIIFFSITASNFTVTVIIIIIIIMLFYHHDLLFLFHLLLHHHHYYHFNYHCHYNNRYYSSLLLLTSSSPSSSSSCPLLLTQCYTDLALISNPTFLGQLADYIHCMDVNGNQSTKRYTGLLGQFATHQHHDICQLAVELLVVFLETMRATPDSVVNFLSPVDLARTYYNLE